MQGLSIKQARFARFPDEAAKLITVGVPPPDASLSPADLAAYTATANVQLNPDEVITREQRASCSPRCACGAKDLRTVLLWIGPGIHPGSGYYILVTTFRCRVCHSAAP